MVNSCLNKNHFDALFFKSLEEIRFLDFHIEQVSMTCLHIFSKVNQLKEKYKPLPLWSHLVMKFPACRRRLAAWTLNQIFPFRYILLIARFNSICSGSNKTNGARNTEKKKFFFISFSTLERPHLANFSFIVHAVHLFSAHTSATSWVENRTTA